MELLQRKEPIIAFLGKDALPYADWDMLSRVYGIREYVVFYDGWENIFVNPAARDSQKVAELVKMLFHQRHMDGKSHSVLDELDRLVDGQTAGYIIASWHKWRKHAERRELNEQARAVIKRIRSEKLRSKAQRNRRMIMELFNIGFGLYGGESANDFQEGANTTFMYGYLLGMVEHSQDAKRIASGDFPTGNRGGCIHG